jgi:hypothetical protein
VRKTPPFCESRARPSHHACLSKLILERRARKQGTQPITIIWLGRSLPLSRLVTSDSVILAKDAQNGNLDGCTDRAGYSCYEIPSHQISEVAARRRVPAAFSPLKSRHVNLAIDPASAAAFAARQIFRIGAPGPAIFALLKLCPLDEQYTFFPDKTTSPRMGANERGPWGEPLW